MTLNGHGLLSLENPGLAGQVWLTTSTYPQNIPRTTAPLVNDWGGEGVIQSHSSPVAKMTGEVDRRGYATRRRGRPKARSLGLCAPSVSFADTSPVVFATREELSGDQTACKPGSVPS